MFRFENDTLILDIAAGMNYDTTNAIVNIVNKSIVNDMDFANIRIDLTSMGGSPNYAIHLYHFL